MIKDKILEFLNKRCTLLGIGPMSINCVDVAIELSNKFDIPLFLIASRRQIDSEKFNGGYVNNWSTNSFSKYVKNKDKKKRIMLARDHGGPWQNPLEVKKNLNLEEAMKSAKESFLEDIKSDFKIIHIDPSIDIFKKPSLDEVLERLFILYEYCYSKSQELNKDIIFEIGTEEQSGGTNTQEELEYVLESVKNFTFKNKLPLPFFVVFQCGTKVMETRNIGSFDLPLRIKDEIPAEIQIPKIIEICKKNNVYFKEHNGDYLSNEALSWHPRLGIHATNVAPEFGVKETLAFINILETNGLNNLVEEFLNLSYESKKWEKWIIPNSKISDKEKAIISGHYIFSNSKFIEIKNKAKKLLKRKNIELDVYLKKEIEKVMMRYLTNFRLVK